MIYSALLSGGDKTRTYYDLSSRSFQPTVWIYGSVFIAWTFSLKINTFRSWRIGPANDINYEL
jgi:hypothetical protein